MKQAAVYLITNPKNGTLYIGVTSHLTQRIWQHKHKLVEGFSQRYKLDQLVYYELHDDMYSAITREKPIKKWNRQWKIRLIETQNPHWHDLWESIL